MQQSKEKNSKMKTAKNIKILMIFLAVLLLAIDSISAQLVPTPPDSMINISTQSPIQNQGYSMTTYGGTISVVNINTTTQNPHWKAYVGNISGKLSLQDATGNSVYDWNISSIEGEIYATRKSDIVDWNNIACANSSDILQDEIALNITTSFVDSISNTFNSKNHSQFYAGLTPIPSNSCSSTNLYSDGQKTTHFAELLLHDRSYMVYTAILEDSVVGFDGLTYDFQIILPESGLEGTQNPNTYYFYVELI